MVLCCSSFLARREFVKLAPEETQDLLAGFESSSSGENSSDEEEEDAEESNNKISLSDLPRPAEDEGVKKKIAAAKKPVRTSSTHVMLRKI